MVDIGTIILRERNTHTHWWMQEKMSWEGGVLKS